MFKRLVCLLLTVLMLTGLDGVTKPALAVPKSAK